MRDMTGQVHLVGSIPLTTSVEVLRAVQAKLGPHVSRIPDGETGERKFFIDWHIGIITDQRRNLEWISPAPDRYPQLPSFTVRDGITASDLSFGSFGYAAWAQESYEAFARLKAAGVIDRETKFQVNIPTVVTPAIAFFDTPADSAIVEPAYEAALLDDLSAVVSSLPHDQIVVQADIVFEIAHWEGLFPPYYGSDPRQGTIDRLQRYAARIPESVEFGMHMCYGDYHHQHFMQPKDLGVLTDMANAFTAELSHRVAYFHMPVPRDRDDVAFFEPLADLEVGDETQLYLGAIHMTDGFDGTRARIAAARKVIDGFGLATECGFGRRSADTIHDLLELHRALATDEGIHP